MNTYIVLDLDNNKPMGVITSERLSLVEIEEIIQSVKNKLPDWTMEDIVEALPDGCVYEPVKPSMCLYI